MVVDDHPMWRDGVARDLAEAGYDVVPRRSVRASRRSGSRLRCAPDVVVLDLQLPDPSGVDVIHGLRAAVPGARVLVLSASGEESDVLEAVKAGAAGYLLKSAKRDEFLDAVRRTAAGEAVFTPGLAGLVLGEFRRMASDPPDAGLAQPHRAGDRDPAHGREGNLIPRIADRLGLSHRTVQNHVQNTLNKLQLHNRVELARYAIERGLDA